MNDEIKEILDFKEDADYKKLSCDEIAILRDYITNLQEENKRLVELCNKYEEEHNTAFNLWKMKMEEMPTYEEKENYKSRIDKAIELLSQDWYSVLRQETINKVKDILQGSDKE